MASLFDLSLWREEKEAKRKEKGKRWKKNQVTFLWMWSSYPVHIYGEYAEPTLQLEMVKWI